MESICREVSTALRSLSSLAKRLDERTEELAPHSIDVVGIKAQIAGLVATLDHEFDRPMLASAQAPHAELAKQLQLVRGQLRYHRKRRADAKVESDAERSLKLAGRMRSIWCVRAGLSPPTVPLRTMADFLSQFPMHHQDTVGHCHIS